MPANRMRLSEKIIQDVIQIKLVALFLSSYSSSFAIPHILYQTLMLEDTRCISVNSFLLLWNWV